MIYIQYKKEIALKYFNDIYTCIQYKKEIALTPYKNQTNESVKTQAHPAGGPG